MNSSAISVDGFVAFQFYGHTGHGHTAGHFGANRDHFMSFDIVQNFLAAVVAAAVFAIMPQKACADCNSHRFLLKTGSVFPAKC